MNLIGKRVLIVEDEAAVQVTLKARLEAIGYETLSACDGDEGLRMAREEEPDLIILDVMLPKMDGLGVCRLLKSDQRYRHIPVLVLSGRASDPDRERGLNTGADAYMTKPFDSIELVGTVRRLLKEK